MGRLDHLPGPLFHPNPRQRPAGGERRGLLVHKRGVHQVQRLGGGDRGEPLGHALVRVGGIEQCQERMAPIPLLHQVQAAMPRLVHRVEWLMNGERPRVGGREGMRTRWTAVELPAHEQHGVADGLGVEWLAGVSPQPAISRVAGQPLGQIARIKLVDRRPQDQPVQRLQTAPRLQEPPCQPFEQLGMRGEFAPRSEVAGGRDQPPAKVPAPDPVHKDPGQQGLVRAGQPVGQLQPATAGGPLGQPVTTQDLQVLPGNLLPGLIGLAPFLKAGVDRRPLAHAVRGRIHLAGRHCLAFRCDLFDLLFQPGQLLGHVGGSHERGHGVTPRDGKRHCLQSQVVDVAGRSGAGHMPHPVADHRVENAIPRGIQFLVAEGGEVTRRSDHSRPGLRLGIERRLQCVPDARLDGADDLPGGAVLERKFRPADTELQRQRLDHSPPQVEAVRAGLIGPRDGPEIDRETESPTRAFLQLVREDIANAIGRQATPHPHAALPRGVNVREGTLGFGPDRVRSRRQPRGARRFAVGLPFEGEIGATGEPAGVEFPPARLQRGELGLESGDSLGPLGFQSRDLAGGDQWRKLGGALVFFTTGKRPPGALQNAVETVIVVRRDGVVLVVVAPRTADREPQQRAPDRVDHVGEIEMLVVGVGGVAIPLAHRQEAGGGETVGVLLGGTRRGEQVPGDLQPDELGEGQIALHRPHHPVAVAIGFANGIVGSIARRIGVAGHIEPVPAPAFTIPLRLQQAVNDAVPRPGLFVGQERLDFGGRGREPGQVEGDPAEQCAAVSRGSVRQPFAFETCEHKPIEVGLGPASLADLGEGHGLEGLPAPPAAGFVSRHASQAFPGDAWIDRAGLDPRGDRGDFVGGQPLPLPGRGHLQIGIGIFDSPQQQAFGGLARHNRRPRIAPLLPTLASI